MEDLRSLMACLDDISSKIPDGIYLEMANTMKRVHDHMNGNKSVHEDTFYDDDDAAIRLRARERAREDIRDNAYLAQIRNEIKAMVMRMRGEFKYLKKLDKDVTKTVQIKRMTAQHKSGAIKAWCERMDMDGKVLPNIGFMSHFNKAILVGCVSSIGATEDGGWTWKNLVEWGLRTIVLEIGTEDEIERAKRGLMFYDELSLKTLQKLHAFEKKIYDDYKEECHMKWNSNVEDAEKKVRESEKKMDTLERACIEREYVLGDNNVEREWRDFWSIDRNVFTTGRTIL